MGNGAKRTVGRPRARENGSAGPARQAILLASAELFASQGYAGTSTREIAERVGIRQPSLFYHFPKKDEILHAIVDEAGAGLLDRLPEFERPSGRAAVRLYELMTLDFRYLMTEPYGIGKLLQLPELRSGELRESVESKRNRIIGAYRKLISRGVREGDFVCSDLKVATFTVFGMGEAVWSWYRPSRTESPGSVAEKIADLALRALLREPGMLESIKEAAHSKDED